ncbi:GreA/GreB family elongation factor [Caldimonas thermodepolymerans]|jgi:Transcription elongation factor|uniref:Regulator of nucleoside diphosphate kinase n=1 Tax=Caldimonas thermodepolymerans TaxID=215580 RepID=A0A2S5T1M1_9BURK|nr:GreA/GreB family elongation factor [Caldimonas thermodepolymerans]PPE68873.1 transcription elongation factor [Caldimonas thermodepolymerans]QPC30426.1 GreA/GreB family elongation factor [Caldimonas thermodepolymerans]RDI02995.1 regulator of nucleoside diphosphate kinase [Caldimonas thermodepolymerans]TCP08529.1 regulator of nucleoside diphosphate kinase [Caldimonas thermodepolymerans]UZG43192.1 GreA/GreB family elongation factor [Caldimonas thermodepolymerans]
MEVLAQERLLTGLDHARLSSLLFKPRFAASLPAGLAETARELLDFARVVDATQVDPDIVTMRSRVIVERPGIGEINLCLVYPSEADPDSGCISVLTPLGLSLLGARVGQVITWTGPDQREHSAKVLRMVYQPESAGDYAV